MASVLDCLHYGKQNAVTREYLKAMTGYSDRRIRREIRRLRVQEDIPIFNLQDGDGYFLATPNDEKAMDDNCNIQWSRTKEDRELLVAMWRARHKVMYPDGVQIELPEKEVNHGKC